MWTFGLQLGRNMWDDFGPEGPDGYAKSVDEEATKPQPMMPSGREMRYHSYRITTDEAWRESIDHLAARGFNAVMIELAEAVEYPSHPELGVAGMWRVGKLKEELAYVRSKGMTPIPSLNFSCSHDAWLKWYHRMLSTPAYYRVVEDVIVDTYRAFESPEYLSVGWDEEYPQMGKGCFINNFRTGELLWHDLDFTCDAVRRLGAKPMMWSDFVWHWPEQFRRHVGLDVIQGNWYYNTVDPADTLPPTVNGSGEARAGAEKVAKKYGREKFEMFEYSAAGAFKRLEDFGYTQMPVVSNYRSDESPEIVLRYCKEHLDQSKVIGYQMSQWNRMNATGIAGIKKSADVFAAAREKVFGE